MDTRRIACHYARTWLILDTLATVPFDLLTQALVSRGRTSEHTSAWIARLQLVRLVRVGRVPRILGRLEMRAGLQTTQSSAIGFVLMSAL
jgi:hypothetical protein